MGNPPCCLFVVSPLPSSTCLPLIQMTLRCRALRFQCNASFGAFPHQKLRGAGSSRYHNPSALQSCSSIRRCRRSFYTSSCSQSRVSNGKEQDNNLVMGRVEGGSLQFLIGVLAASFLLFDFSNSAAAFAVDGGIIEAPDDKQLPGIDSLSTKPGLVERLVERTKANKAKYDQERLDNYYRRNYKDYFDFLKGRLVNRDPETLTEAERGILKWLEKNS